MNAKRRHAWNVIELLERHPVLHTVRTLLRGIGQIMLQGNVVSGALFLAGVLAGSPRSGIGLAVGVVAGTATAKLLKYDDEIDFGVYGYNGALVGAALFSLFQPDIVIIALTIAGSAASSVVLKWFRSKSIVAYTFPFIVTTWLCMALISLAGLIDSAPAPELPSERVQLSSGEEAAVETAVQFAIRFGFLREMDFKIFMTGTASGFGQVIFQSGIVPGVLCFAGLLVASRKAAMLGLFGAALGLVFGWCIGASGETLASGVFGFNALLCGIGCAALVTGNRAIALMTIIATTLISTGLYAVFLLVGLPALTFPFVAAMWITLFIGRRFRGQSIA